MQNICSKKKKKESYQNAQLSKELSLIRIYISGILKIWEHFIKLETKLFLNKLSKRQILEPEHSTTNCLSGKRKANLEGSLLNYLKRVYWAFCSSYRKTKARGLAHTLSRGFNKISGSKSLVIFCWTTNLASPSFH